MVTVKNIAEKLGLSSATVSRTLRNDETLSITPETRARILMTADELGYVGNRAKKKKAEKQIMVVHKHQTFRNQIDSAYYFSIRTGIEDFFRSKKTNCTFLEIESLQDSKLKPDAVLLVGNYSKIQYDMLLTHFPTLPVTAIGTVSYYPGRIDHITYSNSESVQMAVSYLWDNGHEAIGYLGIVEHDATQLFGSRKETFINLMKSRHTYKKEWICECDRGKDRVEEGYNTILQWIKTSAQLPSALFCANDPAALGAVKALQECQIRVPDDISIVSHDGSYITPFTYPELTTVDVHPYHLGFEGAAMAYERLESKRKISKRLYLVPELIIRDSVKPYKEKPNPAE